MSNVKLRLAVPLRSALGLDGCHRQASHSLRQGLRNSPELLHEDMEGRPVNGLVVSFPRRREIFLLGRLVSARPLDASTSLPREGLPQQPALFLFR